MKTVIYKGMIELRPFGENDEALFIGDMEEPLAMDFQNNLQNEQVSVRYFVSKTDKTKEELEENLIKTMLGSVDADYGDHYGDITGYLWTDEELKIGGHDLLNELSTFKGKYVFLEIDVHE